MNVQRCLWAVATMKFWEQLFVLFWSFVCNYYSITPLIIQQFIQLLQTIIDKLLWSNQLTMSVCLWCSKGKSHIGPVSNRIVRSREMMTLVELKLYQSSIWKHCISVSFMQLFSYRWKKNDAFADMTSLSQANVSTELSICTCEIDVEYENNWNKNLGQMFKLI